MHSTSSTFYVKIKPDDRVFNLLEIGEQLGVKAKRKHRVSTDILSGSNNGSKKTLLDA